MPLREVGLDALLSILDELAQDITLVVEQRLVPSLSALCPYSVLSQRGVSKLLTLPIDRHIPDVKGAILYIGTGAPSTISDIASSIKHNLGSQVVLAAVPWPTPDTKTLLEAANILGDIKLVSFPLHFSQEIGCPGLYSLHFSTANLMETVAPQPTDVEWLLAKALDNVRMAEGDIARISGIGPAAFRIREILKSSQRERITESQTGRSWYDYKFSHTFYGCKGIDHLILIDRDVDLVTPQLTQASYAGVLSELFGIAPSGNIDTGKQKLTLRNDPLYEKIAILGFADACQQIHQSAKDVQASIDERPGQNESIADIKNFVANLGSLKETQRLVKLHIELAAEAMEKNSANPEASAFYELQNNLINNNISASQALKDITELIYRQAPVTSVLRLLSLLCLVKGGVRSKDLNKIYDELFRAYGPNAMVVIQNMERKELLFSSTTKSTYATILKKWKLMTADENDNASPAAAAAAAPYGGLVPLSAAIAAAAVSSPPSPLISQDFESFDDLATSDSAREAKLRRILLRNTPGCEIPTVAVAFIGGVTYSEAAAVMASISEAAFKSQGRAVEVKVFTTGVID